MAKKATTTKRRHTKVEPAPPLSPPPPAWRAADRCPDPAVRVLDPRFEKYYLYNARVERLAEGFRWAEGPVWFGDGRTLLWSDIPNDRIMRWDEETGAVGLFRKPSRFANGNTRDRQGRLVTCEHGGRCVSRTEYDGTVTVLVDRYEGKRLNSPNDVVVKSDDTIWFSDPQSGIRNNYLGVKTEPELPTNLYRFDPKTGNTTIATSEINFPNGLCFSPDETRLYVVESGSRPRHVHVFDVVEDGTALANGRVFIDCGEKGRPDGIRCDVDGNLWAGWGEGPGLDGVVVFAPDGDLIGQILLPERCANLCFGGLRRNRLFMASYTSLYSLFTNAEGIPGT
jgi:gluconolactonase